MFELRIAEFKGLSIISEFGNQEHTKPFLNSKSMVDYKRELTEENITYLCLVNTSNVILGYLIIFKRPN